MRSAEDRERARRERERARAERAERLERAGLADAGVGELRERARARQRAPAGARAHKHHRLRKGLVCGGVAIALASAATLAAASQRIEAEQAAYRAPAVARCQPSTLNRSALLPGTSLDVSPLPGSYAASPRTQISLLGAPAGAISDVSAKGSRSGVHDGRLRAYSQGDGASFVANDAFLAGETVTVRGKLRSGSRTRRFSYSFVVATPDTLPYSKPNPPSGLDYNEKMHFRSAPKLEAPVVSVTARSPSSAPGEIFAAPYSGPGPAGPMIFDEAGNLVWFDPLPGDVAASNLQVQRLNGKPVLTWWQGYIPKQGFGEGEELIYDSSYRQLGRVHAGNGYKVDLHDFHLTGNGTALLTVFDPIDCDVSSVGGPTGGAVNDSVMQEVDLRTGLVRREWHSVDHVALAASYSTATGASHEWPFDYFHINSIDQRPDGTTLISARNTWAMYLLNTRTGQLQNSIGGRHSGVKLGEGTQTAYQHDATTLAGGEISVFDNGSVPKVHPQSRGLVLALNAQTDTATVAAQFEHSPALTSDSQGNIQQLENDNFFVGWGSRPYFSEYSAAGQLLFDAHWHGSYESYRGYRFAWTGAPAGAPSIAAAAAAGGRATVYASWNGATDLAAWEVLGGSRPDAMSRLAVAPRAAFETAIELRRAPRYVAVRAFDRTGAPLRASQPVAVR
jgi:acyl-coenzyme A thioesterase PaaI-like protein